MDNLLSHATPTDGLGQRNACADFDAFVSPSAAALRPTCAAFVYRRIVTPVCCVVTRKLSTGSNCVLLRTVRAITFRQCENFVSREHVVALAHGVPESLSGSNADRSQPQDMATSLMPVFLRRIRLRLP